MLTQRHTRGAQQGFVVCRDALVRDLLQMDILKQQHFIEQKLRSSRDTQESSQGRFRDPFYNRCFIAPVANKEQMHNKILYQKKCDFVTFRGFKQEGFDIYLYIHDADWDQSMVREQKFKDVNTRASLAVFIPAAPEFIQARNYPFDATLATYVLNGYSFQYGRVIELVRAAIGRPERPVLNLSLITTPIKNLTWNHVRENAPWVDFAISPKLDGLHCVVVMQKGQGYILSERNLMPFQYNVLNSDLTILEGELMDSRLYLYDCITLNGKQVLDAVYKERLALLQHIGELKSQEVTFISVEKQFSNSAGDIQRIINTERDRANKEGIPTDGFIFQSNGPYRDNEIFKWKPVELCTVDFLVICPSIDCPGMSLKMQQSIAKSTGAKDNKTCVLYASVAGNFLRYLKRIGQNIIQYNGISHTAFNPSLKIIGSSPFLYRCDKELMQRINGTICEFSFKDGKWHLHKQRPDKNRANAYPTAESVFTQLMNPIEQTDLSSPRDVYFEKKDEGIYKNMRRYMNAVKQQVFSKMLKGRCVLDLGIGRGQDVQKYQKAEVLQVVGIDADMQALQEIIERKHSIIFQDSEDNNLPLINLIQCDMTGARVKEIADHVTSYYKPDAVVSMFAIHYFFRNPLVYDLIDTVQKNGIVLLSVFDAQRFGELMKDASTYKRGNYEYHRTPGSNIIKLKLPFSDELYSEELVDLQFLEHMMLQKKLILFQKFAFDDPVLSKYKHLETLKQQCSQDDLVHVGLYSFLVFTRRRSNSTK